MNFVMSLWSSQTWSCFGFGMKNKPFSVVVFEWLLTLFLLSVLLLRYIQMVQTKVQQKIHLIQYKIQQMIHIDY